VTLQALSLGTKEHTSTLALVTCAWSLMTASLLLLLLLLVLLVVLLLSSLQLPE
jgi:hypothetical protein